MNDSRFQLEHTDAFLVNVHNSASCFGRPCTIHNRSDHHMRSFPQHWRDDLGIIERICLHGVGHPDPDENMSSADPRWQHGCDGCCNPSLTSPSLPFY